MIFINRLGLFSTNFNNVMNKGEASDDNTLAWLKSIDSSMNIDRVSTENSQHYKIDFIEYSELKDFPKDKSRRDWHDNTCFTIIHQKKSE